MEIATHDLGQWAAIVAAVIAALTYSRSQIHKREEQASSNNQDRNGAKGNEK